MKIRKHKICDICKNEVGINNRYYTLKGKNIIISYGGSAKDNRTIHICEDCLYVLKELIIKYKPFSCYRENGRKGVKNNDNT